MDWVIEYDICALLLLSILFWILIQKKNIPSLTNRVFRVMLLIGIISTVFDIVGIYAIIYSRVIPLWLNYVIQAVYLLTFNSLSFIHYAYVLSMTAEHRQITTFRKMMVAGPAVVVFLLIVTSPFTKWIFYFNEDFEYCHGSIFYFLYGIAVMYLLSGFVVTIRYQKLLTKAQKSAVFWYIFSIITAVGLQIVFPKTMLIGYAVAISALLVFYSLQNPEDYIDKPTGLLNRKAFVSTLNSLSRQKAQFTVICIEPDDFKFLSNTLGISNGESIILSVAQFLRKCAPHKQLFHLTGIQFALLLKHKEPMIDDIVREIHDRFQTPFIISGIEVMLNPLMCCIHYPENANYVEDVLDAIEHSIIQAKQLEQEQMIVYANESILIKKRRESAINHITRRAIQNNEFEIFYHPIYSATNSTIIGAEALIRLQDSALGYISPDEFIPITEKNGTIMNVGAIVFEMVCSYIKLNRLQERSIDRIGINLSVIQCMQEQLATQLLEIMKLYNVSPCMINLEITEASVVHINEHFRNNMLRLAKEGVTFSLDGYGIGFSNAEFLTGLPFHTIKLSKEILWDSSTNDKVRIALKHTVAMLLDMNFEVAAEGIENPEQALFMSRLGCQLLQGFFYSKPLKAEEFIALLDQ